MGSFYKKDSKDKNLHNIDESNSTFTTNLFQKFVSGCKSYFTRAKVLEEKVYIAREFSFSKIPTFSVPPKINVLPNLFLSFLRCTPLYLL